MTKGVHLLNQITWLLFEAKEESRLLRLLGQPYLLDDSAIASQY